MKQQELAEALGVNQSQVSRYAARGMPLDDLAGAQAWIRQHVRLTMKAPMFRRQTRPMPRQAEPEQRKLSTAELLELIDDLIGLAVGVDFEDGCRHIRTCFLELPPEAQNTVRLPFAVWNALCGEDTDE